MMNAGEWARMIQGKKDCMPGEDGFPCSAWKVSAAAKMLFARYRAFFRDPHAGLPDDMKHSLMVFSLRRFANVKLEKQPAGNPQSLGLSG